MASVQRRGSSRSVTPHSVASCNPRSILDLFVSDRVSVLQLRDAFRSLLGEDQFRNIAQQLQFGVGQDALSDFERMAIWIYTTAFEYHKVINRALWTGETSPEIASIVRCLDGAITKLPRFDGYVYRGLDLDPWTLSRYTVGSDMNWPGFSSTTTQFENAFTGNTLFVIRSVSGRTLGPYLSQFHEGEVLFRPASWFKVLAIDSTEIPVVITLKEIG